MDQLEQARETVNCVDREMAELFARRMEAVKIIAAYKQERGLPITDAARESVVIGRNLSVYPDLETKEFYEAFLRNVMELSKDYQKSLRE